MTALRIFIAAILVLVAGPAVAQQIEGVPNFKECKDGSLDKALKDGIHWA